MPPYSVTFLSGLGGGGDPYPSPTALIKIRIGLGWVFLINSGFSLPEPREEYPLECCGQNKVTNLHDVHDRKIYQVQVPAQLTYLQSPVLLSALGSPYGTA